MTHPPLQIVIIGLSITSSWGNGHATTFRALTKALKKEGHQVLFLEKDMPWYAANRDLPNPDGCKTELYYSLDDLKNRFTVPVREADMVVVGSYIQEGIPTEEWVVQTAEGVTAFYDIDTPVTLAKLHREDYEYLHPDLIPQFDLYLSFSGGPTLEILEKEYGSPHARPFYCSVDPDLYFPEEQPTLYDLGYLGTYSDDRQPPLERLMLDAARQWQRGRFVVAGPQYPNDIEWPKNVERIDHLSPAEHRPFYNQQRFTLNVTRADMIRAGYSPSVRLFEAAACGVPIISDYWEGLDSFFEFGKEILISRSADETLEYLTAIPEEKRQEIGQAARRKILHKHTAKQRAAELVAYYSEVVMERA